MKYSFGSPEWLAALHGIIVERATTLGQQNPRLWMSTCEVFTNAPADIADATGKIAWSCVVEGTKVDFQRTERDLRYKVVADYNAILPMARYAAHGDPERRAVLTDMIAKLLASGQMQRPFGNRADDPDAFPKLHDVIAGLTV